MHDTRPPALGKPSTWRSTGLVASCLLVAAFNLRPALTSLATLLAEIQSHFQSGSFWSGLLTTTPVICFGLFGPLAPLLSSRLGLERALAFLFLLLAISLGLRFVPLGGVLLVSTLAAGAAIGMAGVLLPVIIRRDFHHRLGVMTGLYTMILSLGGAGAAAITPVIEAETGAWSAALAAWSVPALAAAILWGSLASGESRSVAMRPVSISALFRDPIAWDVTAFMSLQAALAFIVLGWLPTLLRDRGLDLVDAGFATSVSIMAQTLTSLFVPPWRPGGSRRAFWPCSFSWPPA